MTDSSADVLAPLTASTDLPHHPTLSKPFTSKTLDELIDQSCTLMRKENQSLWQVRHLWTSLCGDGVWIPCETMVGSNDIDLFSDEHVARFLQSLSSNDEATSTPLAVVNGDSKTHNAKGLINDLKDQTDGPAADADVPMVDAAGSNEDKDTEVAIKKGTADGQAIAGESKQTDDRSGNARTNGDSQGKQNGKDGTPKGGTPKELGKAGGPSESETPSFIHPMFLPPPSAKPDRNMGIPENEAEDIRRLLALYVQKQEEVTRGASRLHQGLLRAERLRGNVLDWAKAEAHCGPNRDMSDGEDWYDKEAWGLTEDLKKGQDEEEEDTTTTGKKTRNRRAN